MPDDFTDSDRAELRAMAKEREHAEWLKQRRADRWSGIKTWAQWIAALWVAKGILWDALSSLRDVVSSHLK